jgi:hypothetical protein
MHTSTACYGWDPETGEQKVFDSPEAREAEGWLDHHPLDEDKGGAGPGGGADDESDDLTRDEIVAALKEGGIKHNARAATLTLLSTLDSSLRVALKAKGIAFEDATPTRDLLALIKGQ